MPNSWHADSAALIADLNDLIQLDRDAVETYTVALNSVTDETLRATLVTFRADHQRRAEALAEAVRSRGAMAIELPHVTGPFKMAIQAMGGVFGRVMQRDANVLLALRIVEGQVREKYARYGAKSWPVDIAPIVKDGAATEAQHYAWVMEQLRAAGYGDQSLAGSVSAAAESLHTLLASPIEAATRQATQFFEQNRPDRHMARPAKASTIVEGFRNALHAVETTGSVDWMVTLFGSTAQLSSPRQATPDTGTDGARRFWTEYRSALPVVSTTIDHVSEAPGVATLQWTSRGVVDGADVTWRGITVLEHADHRITRMLQLYDAAQLKGAGVGV